MKFNSGKIKTLHKRDLIIQEEHYTFQTYKIMFVHDYYIVVV